MVREQDDGQHDSGIFSDSGHSLESDLVVSRKYSSVMDRLDRLEEKLSFISSQASAFSTVKTGDREGGEDSEEDREIKQMLFRKLTTFRNKQIGKK